MNRRYLLLSIILSSIMTTACGGGGATTPQPTATPTTTPSAEPTAAPTITPTEDPTPEPYDFDQDGIVDSEDPDDDNDGIDDGSDTSLQVNFPIASLPPITEILFDTYNQRLYLTHKSDYSLTVLNAKNGDLEATIEFTNMPERIAMTPDGGAIYVALLAQEHSSYWWEEEQTGQIAEINPVTMTVVNTLDIATDPYDIVATNSNQLVVASGSGQWTSIHLYAADSGELIDSAGIRQMSRLYLHPSENWVYAADTDTSPSDFEKFSISTTEITSLGDSPYHGDHRVSGNVWVTPDSNTILTRGGDLFNSSDMSFIGNLTSSDEYIVDVSFDADTNLGLIVTDNQIRLLNTQSLFSIGKLGYPGEALFAGLTPRYAIVLSEVAGSLNLQKEVHPCPACATNTAPTATFSYNPINGSTTDTYTFDASSSTDSESPNALYYRWDIDADGIYESTFSEDPTFDHRFLLAGTHYAKLQVLDAGGLVSNRLLNFEVTQGIDYGTEIANSVAYDLSFNINDKVVDNDRNKAFILDHAQQKLFIINVTTGLTEREYSFDFTPHAITLTPDGSTAFIAMLSRPFAYNSEDAGGGYIFEFDLEQMAIVSSFEISIDPYDIVVTSDNKLVVSSGSNQWTAIHMYDTNTGNLLSTSSIRHRSNLHLHPSETLVFAANTDLSPSNISAYSITDNVLSTVTDSPYHGNYRMDGYVWATPDGEYIITRGGDLFHSPSMTYELSITPQGVSVLDLSFDSEQNILFILGSDSTVYYYNLSTYFEIGQFSAPEGASHLILANNELLLPAASAGVGTTLVPLSHPCANCGNNAAPTASFSATLESISTADTIGFDASTSADTEDGTNLSYRWDFNNDGEFDTSFSNSSATEYKYLTSGARSVLLQVKDSLGQTDTVSLVFDVSQGVEAATQVADSEINETNYPLTHYLHDTTREKLYVIAEDEKRLYIFNLASSLTEAYFEFPIALHSLSLSPDSSHLYIGLGPEASDNDYGHIAQIDLTDLTHDNTFRVQGTPLNMVVSSSGTLVLSANNTGQYANQISAYNLPSGSRINSVAHDGSQHLYLRNADEVVFALDDSYATRFDLSASGFSYIDQQYINGQRSLNGGGWISSDGELFITKNGELFDVETSLTSQKLMTEQNVTVKSAVFDETENLLFIIDSNNEIKYYNLTSLLEIGNIPSANATATLLFSNGDVKLLSEWDGNTARITTVDHPCDTCGENTAPTAAISISPENGSTADTFIMDASSSYDSEDALEDLMFSWDINNDGVFDTAFNSDPTFETNFILSGTKTVVVLVRDSMGLLASHPVSFDVAQGIHPGITVDISTPYSLIATVSDIAVDEANQRLYISDKYAEKLYIVDLTTGLTLKYFDFGFMVENLALDVTNGKLYAALLTQDHSPYWWDEDQEGYIAEIDLDTSSHTNTFYVNIDPYGMVVTSMGKLIVTSGSGQWTSINAYNAVDGTLVGSAGSIYDGSKITLHPSEKWVFTADTGLSPSDIEKFDIEVAGISPLGDSPYHGDHRMSGNVWAEPNGNYVVTRGGDVFLASDMTYAASLINSNSFVEDAIFDSNANTALLLESGGLLNGYSLESLTFVEHLGTYPNAVRIFSTGLEDFVIIDNGANIIIETR